MEEKSAKKAHMHLIVSAKQACVISGDSISITQEAKSLPVSCPVSKPCSRSELSHLCKIPAREQKTQNLNWGVNITNNTIANPLPFTPASENLWEPLRTFENFWEPLKSSENLWEPLRASEEGLWEPLGTLESLYKHLQTFETLHVLQLCFCSDLSNSLFNDKVWGFICLSDMVHEDKENQFKDTSVCGFDQCVCQRFQKSHLSIFNITIIEIIMSLFALMEFFLDPGSPFIPRHVDVVGSQFQSDETPLY